MAATRRNILTSATDRDRYIQGIILLKEDDSGLTSDGLQIPRAAGVPNRRLSTYDLFVLWHTRAMEEMTPPGTGRNAAHRGPVFLPWHRFMMILLERNFQRGLNDPDFGLPYWDWAADGERPVAQQPNSAVWAPDCMGGDGNSAGEVTTGPFAANTGFRVRVSSDINGQLVAVERPLRRRFRAGQGFGLPRRADVARSLSFRQYDLAPWDVDVDGFRNTLEGWRTFPNSMAPNLHNRVHVWIGGDMGPASSPNDLAFFLNHCNVDRIWAACKADSLLALRAVGQSRRMICSGID